MAWAQNLLGLCFLYALPTHLFLGFCLVFSGFQKQRFGIFLAAVSHGLGTISPAHLFLGFGLVFSGLQKQRFGIFLAAVSHGLGTISLFLVGSKICNVSAFFRLQFRNGLGTKPAGALLFRMRSPSTFFLGFALFLVGSVSAFFWLRFRMAWARYLYVFSGIQKQRLAFCRLQFRNGLGTKPAGALFFRMRSPSTFFLSFALFLFIFIYLFIYYYIV